MALLWVKRKNSNMRLDKNSKCFRYNGPVLLVDDGVE